MNKPEGLPAISDVVLDKVQCLKKYLKQINKYFALYDVQQYGVLKIIHVHSGEQDSSASAGSQSFTRIELWA